MRELARDKGRLEDIVEYSANVLKILEGMRHVLVHGYSQVLPRILWNTAKHDIPAIKMQVEKYLMNIDWDKYFDQ